jgi:hypothetical protein
LHLHLHRRHHHPSSSSFIIISDIIHHRHHQHHFDQPSIAPLAAKCSEPCPAPSDTHWQCRRCNEFLAPSESVCNACNSVRPSLNTWECQVRGTAFFRRVMKLVSP